MGAGVLFLATSLWTYINISNAEIEGGTVVMNSLTALAYDLGGKWGAVGFEVLIGLALVALGVYRLKDTRNKAAQLAIAERTEEAWREQHAGETERVPSKAKSSAATKCDWCGAPVPQGATHCDACDSDLLPKD